MRRVFFSLVFLLVCGVHAGAESRLNVLFVFADDFGRHAGAYAKADGPGSINDVIRTPHMDRLQTGQLDRTLIVLSGDHGMPGVPDGKCNLYGHGTAVPLIMRLPGGRPGRVVEDMVCLPDLAPTFLEVAGVRPPDGLYGRSLLPVLRSEKQGRVDPSRTWVIFGRERHVDIAREEARPYPTRERMAADLLARLSEAGDPRVQEPVAFEAPPFTEVTPKGGKDGPSR